MKRFIEILNFFSYTRHFFLKIFHITDIINFIINQYSGARKDSDIYCWDVRHPGKILRTFKRDVQTNQRIYFDLDDSCKYLCSGNNDGSIKFEFFIFSHFNYYFIL